MSLPSRGRLALLCALVSALALVPNGAARAGLGSLYSDLACREMTDIAGEFDFETSFVGLEKCDRLCLDAAIACTRYVKDAASCQMQFSSDWIAFDSKLDCAGLTGAELRDCKAGWALDKKFWQDRIKNQRGSGLSSCGFLFSSCVGHCSGV